jgi:DNA anti-recombination protein RmuC
MDPEIKAEERDPKKLVRAMQMVTKVLMQEELQSVRQAVADLETRLDERFEELKEELKKELTESIDKARDELGSRIDPLFETMSEAERFRSEVIADLESQVEKAQSTADEGIKTLRTTLEESLAEKEAALRRDFETLAEEQVGLRKGVQEQVENSKRLSGVLQNLASVFAASTGGTLPGTSEKGIAVSEAGDEEVVIEDFLDQAPGGGSAGQGS